MLYNRVTGMAQWSPLLHLLIAVVCGAVAYSLPTSGSNASVLTTNATGTSGKPTCSDCTSCTTDQMTILQSRLQNRSACRGIDVIFKFTSISTLLSFRSFLHHLNIRHFDEYHS